MKAVTCLAEYRARRAAALAELARVRGDAWARGYADGGARADQIERQIAAGEDKQ